MKKCKRTNLRADLRAVRQDVLIKIEEAEFSLRKENLSSAPEEKTAPAMLETIAQRLLDELGGGEFRIMLRGEQTIEQRAAEYHEEDLRRLKLVW